jgi:hypothetical protein
MEKNTSRKKKVLGEKRTREERGDLPEITDHGTWMEASILVPSNDWKNICGVLGD